MKRLKIYFTTDTHGFLFPTNYQSRDKLDMGLISAVSSFSKDGNTLIIDAGDSIQGSPFVKQAAETAMAEKAVAKVFNFGNYDYMTLGNHDFNHGYERLRDYVENLNVKCLLANVVDKTGEIDFLPYEIREMENGLRVGICGIVTDYVNIWEKASHIENFIISDAFLAAKASYEAMKNDCDVSICVYHGGFESDTKTGERLSKTDENVGYKICEDLGFDLLLTGHQHMPLDLCDIHGTKTLQIFANATTYAKIDIEVAEDIKITAETVKVKAVDEIPEVLSDLIELENATQTWLDSEVGTFSEEIPLLPKLDIARDGSRLADFCNQLQLYYTGADISCTSLSNTLAGFSKNLTVRDLIIAFPYSNTLAVLEVDERILRLCLERCAEYFKVENGECEISDAFILPKVEHYNFDFFAQIEYTFDISRPVGERVTKLLYKGEEIGDRKLSLVMNNYRATGTGGYEFLTDCKVIKEYGEDTQELMINYVLEQKNIVLMDRPNYKLIW